MSTSTPGAARHVPRGHVQTPTTAAVGVWQPRAAPHGGRGQRSAGRRAPALFLDRDGTLVHPRHYPSRPEDLRLYDGLGPYLRCLQEACFRLVVATNPSGIARCYFTEADLRRMHEHLAAQLAQGTHGVGRVRLDAIYHCPHHPDGVIPALAVRCTCRKPQPGMVLRAV